MSLKNLCFLSKIFYLCYLLLFSYVLLCELGPNLNQMKDDDDDDEDKIRRARRHRYSNLTHRNDEGDEENAESKFTVPVAEIILIVWTFTYLIDEIMIVKSDSFKNLKRKKTIFIRIKIFFKLLTIQRKSMYAKLKAYIDGFWNLIDLLALLFFFVGMSLRFLPNEKVYITAR